MVEQCLQGAASELEPQSCSSLETSFQYKCSNTQAQDQEDLSHNGLRTRYGWKRISSYGHCNGVSQSIGTLVAQKAWIPTAEYVGT